MENFYLSAIVREIAKEATGRNIVRVLLAGSTLSIDLRLPGSRLLLASLDRNSPALYISTINPKHADSDNSAAHPFVSLLRKHVAGAKLLGVSKEPLDRIVRLEFEKFDAGGDHVRSSLVLAFTGRTSNAYLNDSENHTLAALADRGAFQPGAASNRGMQISTLVELCDSLDDSTSQDEALEKLFVQSSVFGPQLRNEFIARCRNASPRAAFKSLFDDLFQKEPVPLLYSRLPLGRVEHQLINPKVDLLLSHIELSQAVGMLRLQFPTLSEAAEQYYRTRDQQKALRDSYNSTRQLLTQEIRKIESALSAIENDLARFEDPEKLKRCGELIHANLATASVAGSKARVVDYYHPDQPQVDIELGDKKSLLEAAADYFARYQKARRAIAAIATRTEQVARNLGPLKGLLSSLGEGSTADQIAKTRQAADKLVGRQTLARPRRDAAKQGRAGAGKSAGRRFKTTDGFEVAIGRNDSENDEITFRVAKSQDIWMHAADYPGSHVIIRNPGRGEVPHKAIIEAAELAAFYSQAKQEGKAAVHYTQKKFVSKPPKAKPGLVRLSSFKTVLVEPRCDLERLD
ncbi:MAG TPA: NFACT RNA binding domain-containing protein [Blastocatellia bacterium]|jgi:predicted ribosome quality control (RQC) complex YloA/Tae2 family protein